MNAISVVAGPEGGGRAPVDSRSRFQPHLLTRYLSGGHRSVEGWLTPLCAGVIAGILEAQSCNGIAGSVGEIGVHHGKLFLVAYLSTRTDETAFAIDVFEQQELNTDHSGKGDRERFLHNVRARAGSTDGLIVIGKDSLKITPAEILEQAGRCRLFSIDGGHTEECTRNDLAIAEACLCERGVIVLDDYFNHLWPDVSVGAAAHFASGVARTKPFAITPNKVFFAEEQHHSFYKKLLQEKFFRHYTRSSRMFGVDVDLYSREGFRGVAPGLKRRLIDEGRIRLAGFPAVVSLAKSLLT